MLLSSRGRRNRNRRAPRRGEDAGNTHVLEAVIVTSIMLSAVVFVVTYDQPASGAADARTGLGTKAEDALAILYDTPVDSKFGEDALSAYIAECMNVSCDNLTARLDKLVPVGASYALYVSNGYSTYPVIVEREPAGEAASATQAFEPRWSSTFLATATESVSDDDPLLVYALPIYHSNVVSPGGSQILVRMTGTRTDGSEYVLTASYSTIAQSSSDLEAVAASLTFVDSAGNPLPVHNLTGALDTPHRVTLRLAETEGGEIPRGAEVAVHVPRGWTATAPADANPAWTILADATDPNGAYSGSTIRASLVDPLSAGADPSAHQDLFIDVTYQGDVLDYYPFVATLSKGATAIGSMLLRGEQHGNDPPGATPTLHMSVPSPMGHGAYSTWTLSAYIPVNDTSLLEGQLSNRVNVNTIEIMEQEGNPIFGDLVPIESMGGEWTTSSTSLVWRGDVDLHFQAALNLSFQVSASGTAGPQESRAPFVPPVTFDTFTGRLVERSGWGFYRQAILPTSADYAGFDTESTFGTTPHPIVSDAVYRSTELPGRTTYNVSELASLQDSLYGSYVSAEDRSVPVGGEVVISANVQSLLFTLAELGQRAGVTLRFYPPWSGDERTPIYEQENLDQGLLAGEVSQMIVLDMNGDGFGDPVVGTTNGRVIAYHGLTGQRLQGNTYTITAAPEITVLEPITLRGEEYIVVATDANGDGIFILDKDFEVVWSYDFQNADTLAADTTTDMDGDGEPEIIVARSYEVGASKNALVYVFKAVDGMPTLLPITPGTPLTQDANAFYYALGTPVTVLGQDAAGPDGSDPGILVPIQTLVDAGITIDRTQTPPGINQGSASTPRAGVQGLDAEGGSTSTMFGAPASVLRDYDYDADGVDDVLLGGASGYVIMANGRVLTQPIYSYIMAPSTAFISADTRSSVETYILTSDGSIIWTDDAWVTSYAPSASVVGAKAIASDEYNSYWVVGTANQIWKSVPVDVPVDDPSAASYPAQRELEPVTILPTIGGSPYDLLSRLHEFRDVWFRGDDGWIVGTRCPIPAVCAEPIVLRTSDGGANWVVLSSADGTLDGLGAAVVDDHLNRINFGADGTGWIVGDGGTLLRKPSGTETWTELDLATTYDLLDVACKPETPTSCLAVGESGAAFETTDGGATWTNRTGTQGIPDDKDLYSVGFVEDDRAYIGSQNAVLARFDDADWTSLPLNYVENNGYVISTAGDGTGFAYGGSAANGRVWLLHDYHIRSQAQTVDLGGSLPGCSRIAFVLLEEGNVTLAQQTVDVQISVDGSAWESIGPLAEPSGVVVDARDPITTGFAEFDGGCELYFRIVMETAGDKTILSPHVRELEFTVVYVDAAGEDYTVPLALDFTTTTQVDAAHTTAAWDTTIGALHQPFVEERWTRDVNGEVHDMQTGYDVVGDAHDDVWVATGDILSENSPDYVIYAGTDRDTVMGAENRVYLLDGRTGHPAALSATLDGEVRHLRVAEDETGAPDVLYATTSDSSGAGTLYALDPVSLVEIWSTTLEDGSPADLETGEFPGPHTAIFVGTQATGEDVLGVGHLFAYNETLTPNHLEWRVIPDDMGKYLIAADVEEGWLFGPYVVEVEVEWSETVTTDGELGQEVLRSARFYDHFMVTPPDLVSPPTPVYTARLLVWMDDWS